MGWVTDVGNQVSRGFNYGVKNFNAPNYVYWWVIPFFITMLISVMITIFILRSMSKSIKNTCLSLVEEEKEDKSCKDAGVPLWVQTLVLLIFPVFVSFLVSAGIYKVGVYINNPKMAAGIMTTGYVVDAFK